MSESELPCIFGIAFAISFIMFIASLLAMGWLFNQLREVVSLAIEKNAEIERHINKISEQEAVIYDLQRQCSSYVDILNKQNGSK